MEELRNDDDRVTPDMRPMKRDANGVVIDGDCNGEEDLNHSDIRPFVSFRDKTLLILHSHKFQLCVIGLVIFDCLLVIAEMLLDLQADHKDPNQVLAAHILHYFSIAILSLFIIELGFKLYAFRLEFFHHKLEVFDAVIIVLSFVLDIVFINADSAVIGSGLLILLRLWRVARILNGVVLSVKTQAEHKLVKERRLRETLEQERFVNQEYIQTLEQEVENLKKILQENGITLPSKSPKPAK